VRQSLKFLVFLGIACSAFAQQPAAQGEAGGGQGQGRGQGRGAGGGGGRGAGGRGAAARPVLVFKEEWKQTPAGGEHGLVAEDVSNPNLDFKVYGVKPEELLVTGTTGDEGNPVHAWTGTCSAACAVTLKDKTHFVDLTGLAKIRWVYKVSGFHQVRPVVKLADGTLLVGDHADDVRTDWRLSEFNISEVKWIRLDPDKVQTKGDVVANPDLSKVDEVGFVDLIAGSGHGAGGWVDVGQIEVYGKAVPRS
jgi:hypothetical protein